MMKIGLALSGGGVRGAAHIGALRAIEEASIKVECISGTSSGSIVAALYAIGYSPDEIREIFMQFDCDSGFNRNCRKLLDYDYIGIAKIPINAVLKRRQTASGLIKGEKIRKFVHSLCQDKGISQISQTKIPLAIPAVDINTSKTVMFVSDKRAFLKSSDIEYLDDVLLCDAIRASIAFPAVFQPHSVAGHLLCDGGIKDNVPVKSLAALGMKKIIAIDLSYCGQVEKGIGSIFEISAQALQIMSYQLAKCGMENDVLLINPEIFDVGLLEFNRIDECISRGYHVTMEAISNADKLM